jgi:hypothetical protein
MSRGLELFDEFIKTHNPMFFNTAAGRIMFCAGTKCGNCPLYPTKLDSSCSISKKDFKELFVTHPEYMI